MSNRPIDIVGKGEGRTMFGTCPHGDPYAYDREAATHQATQRNATRQQATMPIKRIYNDCETTGTDPMKNGLIQWTSIATIDGKEVDRIDLMIQPFPDDVIEDGALEANGITREDLFSESRLKPRDAYLEIIKFLSKHVSKFDKRDKFFWIGYNARFDADFTRQFFIKCGDKYFGSFFWMPPLDIMGLAAFLLMRIRHTLPNFQLKTVFSLLFPEKAEEYQLQEDATGEDPWHDALFDIERTKDVEDKLREMATPKKQQPVEVAS